MCVTLDGTQAKWARSLGWLWSQLVRQLLDTLSDTLSSESPLFDGLDSDHSTKTSRSGGSRGSTLSSRSQGHGVPFTLWHQNRCVAVSGAMGCPALEAARLPDPVQ